MKKLEFLSVVVSRTVVLSKMHIKRLRLLANADISEGHSRYELTEMILYNESIPLLDRLQPQSFGIFKRIHPKRRLLS